MDAIEWIKQGQELGAGEICLNSIDNDGTLQGYDLDLMKIAQNAVSIPLIASGGAGTKEHILEGLQIGCDGALAASIFHFGAVRIPELKKWLQAHDASVRLKED